MNDRKPKRIGDLICLVLLMPLFLWIGWFGILTSFIIGFIANVIEEKSYDR